MRIFFVALLFLYSAQAVCQTFTGMPAAYAVMSEQSAVSAAGAQQALTILSRSDNTACMPMVMVGGPEVFFISPESGHAPSWQPSPYDRPLPFQAQNWPPQGDIEDLQQHTGKMQAPSWSDANAVTQQIASSSSASASSTVSQWENNGLKVIATTRETEVTVNGKTYRAYQQDINKVSMPPKEPQIFNERVIFCR
jgi:hypothetical protein